MFSAQVEINRFRAYKQLESWERNDLYTFIYLFIFLVCV